MNTIHVNTDTLEHQAQDAKAFCEKLPRGKHGGGGQRPRTSSHLEMKRHCGQKFGIAQASCVHSMTKLNTTFRGAGLRYSRVGQHDNGSYSDSINRINKRNIQYMWWHLEAWAAIHRSVEGSNMPCSVRIIGIIEKSIIQMSGKISAVISYKRRSSRRRVRTRWTCRKAREAEKSTVYRHCVSPLTIQIKWKPQMTVIIIHIDWYRYLFVYIAQSYYTASFTAESAPDWKQTLQTHWADTNTVH